MQYEITFLPDNKIVRVDEGASLLEAAQRAGINLNSNCGGKGSCGKCKVEIVTPKAALTEINSPFISPEEKQLGITLACLTKVNSNMTVKVPIGSRIEGKPRAKNYEVISYSDNFIESKLSKEKYPYKPLSNKIYFNLPPPSLSDNRSDQDRLNQAWKKDNPETELFFPLNILSKISATLRTSDWQVTLTTNILEKNIFHIANLEGGEIEDNYALAVDIGTTTVAVNLVDLKTKKNVGYKAAYNSQINYGEDIISRIIYSEAKPENLLKLQKVIIEDINKMINSLVKEMDLKAESISACIAAGNTTMMHLFYGIQPDYIRREPYTPVLVAPKPIPAKELSLNINPEALVYFFPAVASYVGGDMVADILVSGMHKQESLNLLIDVGTNGEITLGNNDWLLCCAASAGPAFEGGGLTCGMRAADGAIQQFEITPEGKLSYQTINQKRPLGICGSGYIELLAELLLKGWVNRAGKFQVEQQPKLIKKTENGYQLTVVPVENSATGSEIILTETDINNLIRAKGAVYTAVQALLKNVGLNFSQLENIYICGGFGNYLNIDKAIYIGLLPDLARDKFIFMGNGALQGAQMALMSEVAFAEAFNIANKMTYIDLSGEVDYMNDYTAALFLPHTNEDDFPSLIEAKKKQKGI